MYGIQNTVELLEYNDIFGPRYKMYNVQGQGIWKRSRLIVTWSNLSAKLWRCIQNTPILCYTESEKRNKEGQKTFLPNIHLSMAFYLNRSLGRKNCLCQLHKSNQKYTWQSFLQRESTKTGWRQSAKYTSSLLLGNCRPEWAIIVFMIAQTSDQLRFNPSCNRNIV